MYIYKLLFTNNNNQSSLGIDPSVNIVIQCNMDPKFGFLRRLLC